MLAVICVCVHRQAAVRTIITGLFLTHSTFGARRGVVLALGLQMRNHQCLQDSQFKAEIDVTLFNPVLLSCLISRSRQSAYSMVAK